MSGAGHSSVERGLSRRVAESQPGRTDSAGGGKGRAASIRNQDSESAHCRVDSFFAVVLLAQWFAAVVISRGNSSGSLPEEIGPTMGQAPDAILLGGAIASLPATLAILYPGLAVTRHAVALAQALFSLLFIHLAHDSAGANYHLFVSLALLTLYRDERVLATNVVGVGIGLGLWGLTWEWLARAGGIAMAGLALIQLCRKGRSGAAVDACDPLPSSAPAPTASPLVENRGTKAGADTEITPELAARTLMEEAPDAIVCFDDEGRIEGGNVAATALFQLEAKEMVGRNVVDLLPGLDMSLVRRPGGQSRTGCVTTPLLSRQSLRAFRPGKGDTSGVPVEVCLGASCVGKRHLVIAIARDVSERQKGEVDLQRAMETAQAAARAKTEFLANMSHEVRTPLTAIMGFAELALENVDSGGGGTALRAALETVRRNGQHLLTIINDILDISRIETGQLRVDRVECSALQVVADVVAQLRPRTVARELELETRVAAPFPDVVRTDPTRLRQILVTLLGNAIRFTERGTVRLEATFEPASTPGGGKLHFAVSDSGIGIATEQLATLFEPFTEVEGAPDRRFGGTGLGLAISKHLAERLGGTISVSSIPGAGSTFHVWIATGDVRHATLLAAPEEALAGERGAARRTAVRIDGRILLAEDGPDNQHLIRVLLGKAGAQVDVVSDGRAAVQRALAALAQGNPYDVILMDMQMPEMDGYESTRRLRIEGYAGSIIALTAHAMTKDRQKCLDAGCDDYIAKPIDRAALLRAIQARAARLEAVTPGA